MLSSVHNILLLYLQPAGTHGIFTRYINGESGTGRYGGQLCYRDVDTCTKYHCHTAADHASYVSI